MPPSAGNRLLLLAQALAIAGLGVDYFLGAIASWSSDPLGSAGNYTALLGAVTMAWVRWDRLRNAAPGRDLTAFVGFAVSASLFTAAHQVNLLALVGLGWCGTVASLLYQQYGWRGLVAMRLPLLLLLVSVPFPGRVLEPLVPMFLDATLWCVTTLLQGVGLAPEINGYSLDMAGGSVTLVRDCSGLNGAVLFVPLTLLLLESCRPVGRWRYLLVCALAAPLAFLANMLRVFVEAVLVAKGLRGEEPDTLHEVFGIVALLLSAAAIWFTARVAHRRFDKAAERTR